MIIPARFNGPPGSGNGGYSAGVLASGTACEVTLRRPPPLDTPLSRTGDQIRAPDGSVIALLAPGGDLGDTVPAVGCDEATAASREYPGFTDHPFPTCYVCGPARPDGLRIFPGPLPDGTTAAPWTVPDDAGPATIWAALDCPGGWAVITPGRPFMLGRISVVMDQMPPPGSQCVVRGACTGVEGRKAFASTALYGPRNELLARGRATWIAVEG